MKLNKKILTVLGLLALSMSVSANTQVKYKLRKKRIQFEVVKEPVKT
jgi:hypothetical protein